jgi:hypothetical protein
VRGGSAATKLGEEDMGMKAEVLHELWRDENSVRKKGGVSAVTEPF